MSITANIWRIFSTLINSPLCSAYKALKNLVPEAHSIPRQTSKMELFSKIFNSWNSLTIFAKSSILDVWLVFEYASAYCYQKQLPEVFFQQRCSKNFTSFAGKHLCWSLFLVKFWRPETLLKRDPNTGVFFWNSQIFKNICELLLLCYPNGVQTK